MENIVFHYNNGQSHTTMSLQGNNIIVPVMFGFAMAMLFVAAVEQYQMGRLN